MPLVWPVVVTDAPLFEAFLDEADQPQVRPIKKGLLIWRQPAVTRHTLVLIYTRECFLNEAAELRLAAKTMCELVVAEDARHTRFKPKPGGIPSKSATGR